MVTDQALSVMAGPFVWGRSDCCTCACDVFASLHGIDPMAPLRGQYRSMIAAYRLIRSYGGWVPMFAELARVSGLQAADGHAVGRLGLAWLGHDYALAIAIEDGLWAGKVDGGMAAIGSEAIAAVVMSCRN